MEIKRLNWIDIGKGFAMVLVMIGHAPFPSFLVAEVYTFHLPLFFFLSGYLFSNIKYNNFRNFFKKKFISLVIPYFCFSFIEYIYWLIINSENDVNRLKPFIGTFYAVRSTPWTPHNGTMWFVACLFVTELIFFFIVKYTRNSSNKIIVYLVLSSIIGYIYSGYVAKNLPWSIDASTSTVVFYGMGYLIKSKENELKRLINKKYLIAFFVSNVIFGYLNYKYLGERTDMCFHKYGNYFLFYVAAISGVMASVIFFRLLKKSEILTYIGQNSMIFAGFHQKILFSIITILISNISFLNTQETYILLLEGSSYVVVSSIVLVPIVYVINNYMSFLLGKGFFKKLEESSSRGMLQN